MKTQKQYLENMHDVRKALTWINSNNLQTFTNFYSKKTVKVLLRVNGKQTLIQYISKSKYLHECLYKPLKEIYN